ncbi:hypothetical protein HYT02_02385 [Candidatus Gottesmanbacteria bacterium]|nr:hypothetical protein [Candidatus Gottesmanbacteria bacterium]
MKTLAKIAKALSVSIEDLLK